MWSVRATVAAGLAGLAAASCIFSPCQPCSAERAELDRQLEADPGMLSLVRPAQYEFVGQIAPSLAPNGAAGAGGGSAAELATDEFGTAVGEVDERGYRLLRAPEVLRSGIRRSYERHGDYRVIIYRYAHEGVAYTVREQVHLNQI